MYTCSSLEWAHVAEKAFSAKALPPLQLCSSICPQDAWNFQLCSCSLQRPAPSSAPSSHTLPHSMLFQCIHYPRHLTPHNSILPKSLLERQQLWCCCCHWDLNTHGHIPLLCPHSVVHKCGHVASANEKLPFQMRLSLLTKRDASPPHSFCWHCLSPSSPLLSGRWSEALAPKPCKGHNVCTWKAGSEAIQSSD